MAFVFRNRRDYSSWSDKKLVSAVLDGDQEVIVYFFYKKFSATFQYHIYKLFRQKVDISDLVDEFFMYLYESDWKRLRAFDPTKAALSTWISTVSYRFFRDYKRSKIDLSGLITISNKWESFRGDWVESIDTGVDMDIKNAIENIKSERDKEIAKRLFLEDAEYEAVAKEYGMTTDYVYTVKNRLLKQIRKELNGYC
ncbi:MAG: sigma-70 family RNA polymerase sigma factor [Bacteroidales bacterium]|nr:sigma-70 family RNA polymerase sigma factor [Candidatus Cryptobacteroides aphodequi]